MNDTPREYFGPARDERLQELQVGDALDDLTLDEHRELAEWETRSGSDSDFDEYGMAAASVFLACAVPSDFAPAPPGIARLLEATAAGWCAASRAEDKLSPRVLHVAAKSGRSLGSRGRRARWGMRAVVVAMVGVAVLVGFRWWPSDAASARSSLVASAADLVRWDWAEWDNPAMAGVTGDVVWSDAAQRGFMRLRGLAANDPSVEQYQLWIVDSKRGLESRFNGGVFDVPDSGEVIVPIESELVVDRPVLFAVTVEKPGGTGISDMTRRAVLAKRPG